MTNGVVSPLFKAEALLKLPYLPLSTQLLHESRQGLFRPSSPHSSQGHALHLLAAGRRQQSTYRFVSHQSQLNNAWDIPLSTCAGKLQPTQTFSFPGQDLVPHRTHLAGLQAPDGEDKGTQLIAP